MDTEDPTRAPSDLDDPPAPWAPLVEEPPGDGPEAPEPDPENVPERTPAPVYVASHPGRPESPPPPPPPPLRPVLPAPGHPFPPGMAPSLRAALGPAPIGANGHPIYGPGSIPRVARRGWARVIDTALAALLWLIAVAAMWANVGADGKLTVEQVPYWALAASRGVDVVYQALAIGLTGRTVGKWIMGLKVEDPQGNRPGLHRATLRILIPDVISLVPVIGPAIAIVAYVIGGTHAPLGRTFYDRGAGTLVVSTR